MRILISLLVVFASILMPIPAAAQDAGPGLYAVLDLGRLDGGDRQTCIDAPLTGSISRLGPNKVAAGEWVDDAGVLVAALYTPDGVIPLTSGPAGGVARDINASGIAVGAIYTRQPVETCESATDALPARWVDGSLEVLPLPTGAIEGWAEAINDAGVIVGWVATEETEFLARWWPTGQIDILPALVTEPGVVISSVGNDVAPDGRVVGTMTWATDESAQTQAFLWDQGAPLMLGALSGGNAFAVGIDATGRVVGNADLRLEQTERAFIWTGGTTIDLWWLPETIASTAYAINDAGIVVGTSYTGDGFERATIWIDGVASNLNDGIDPLVGWQLYAATGIDNDGVIVGIGEFDGALHAFMLLPGVG